MKEEKKTLKKRAKGKNKGYENQYKIEKTKDNRTHVRKKEIPSLYNDRKTLILIIEQHSSLGGQGGKWGAISKGTNNYGHTINCTKGFCCCAPFYEYIFKKLVVYGKSLKIQRRWAQSQTFSSNRLQMAAS